MEKAGFAELRSELLADARGRVLEIGAGTGLNLDHYTGAVTELVLTEPDPHMAKRLRRRVAAAEAPFPLEVVETGAEKIPFQDRSFDTVVATLVFCTIPNAAAAGAEIKRLLRPEGRLLLLEHVRGGHEGRLTRWQDRMERPLGLVLGGLPSEPRHHRHPQRPLRRLGSASRQDAGEGSADSQADDRRQRQAARRRVGEKIRG
jgi:SAM-dependent methyltransferase